MNDLPDSIGRGTLWAEREPSGLQGDVGGNLVAARAAGIAPWTNLPDDAVARTATLQIGTMP